MIDSLLLSRPNALISVKRKKDGIRVLITVANILYINKVSQTHYLEIYYLGLTGEVQCVETRAHLSDYQNVLPTNFFCIDRGVIVNLRFISEYKDNDIWIAHGDYRKKLIMTIDVSTKVIELDFG